MSEHKESKAAKDRIGKMLAKSKVIFMATNGSHGHPNVRAVVPLRTDGVETIWFATHRDSSKIVELAKDGKAVIYSYEPRTMVECRLWGTVTILEDAESIEHVWHDSLEKYFTGQDDPMIRVLRFDTSNGMYCGKDHTAKEFTI